VSTATNDANGNTLSDASGKSYTWDFENRLTQAVVPGTNGGTSGTTTFKYDPFGRRIQKSGPLGTTNYLYSGANLLEQVDQAGSVLAKYTHGDDVDDPFAVLRAGATSYYEVDGLWSVSSLSDATGGLTKTYSYDSFGRLVASTGTISDPFQYTGREFDSETGLYFYRARYYDPTSGRFLGEDPIGFHGGPNFYPYVSNEPTLYRDPTGLLQLCCRPARSVTWTEANACHCFLKLSDGTTLGGYFKPPPFLHKKVGDRDDTNPKDQPDCKDLPGSECKVREAFNNLPTYQIYGFQGTSNAIPYRTLTAAGVPFTMPSCAWGASIRPYPFITGPIVFPIVPRF
jgi:RHS repeat-associated protein